MLTKEMVKAAKAITARVKDTRTALQYLRIHGGFAVVTDGNCLVVEETKDPDAWIRPEKLTTTKEAYVTRNGEGSYVDQKGKASCHYPDQDHHFPDWRSVMPAGWSEKATPGGYRLVGGFDPVVLGNALKAFTGLDASEGPVTLSVSEESWTEGKATLKAVYLKQGGRVALVMPCQILD